MRVAIAGAGNVGRSIAAELVENGHQVLLIDRDPARDADRIERVPMPLVRRGSVGPPRIGDPSRAVAGAPTA